MQRGKQRNKSEGRGDRSGAGGPAGAGCLESEVGRGDCEAQSEQRAGCRFRPRSPRTRAAAAAGPWGRGPGGGRRPGAPTAVSKSIQPRRRVTRFPGPANWEKWLTKLKNLFWLTWWSLGITAHTSSAVPEIHSVSTGSQFTVENLCKRISPAILGTGVSSAAAVIHY